MLTDVTIILDCSGSMQCIADDTIGSINRFIEDQQKVPGTMYITLNKFADNLCLGKCTLVKDFVPLTSKSYEPFGCTALLDAIGTTINERGEAFSRMREDERPSKVIVVIMTDGQENASVRFKKDAINTMISHQRDMYKWEFVFLGANQDSIAEAVSLGISAVNTVNFSHTAEGVGTTMDCLSTNVASLRAGATNDMSYSSAQRATAEDIIKREGK